MAEVLPPVTGEMLKLNNGQSIPSFGLGTWLSPTGEVEQAVKEAVRMGYRLIDCAHAYGNEREIGAAITAVLAEGVCKREDLFITSKLWCVDHAPEHVGPALDITLKDLCIDYLDLYLIHWPVPMTHDAPLDISLLDPPKHVIGYNADGISATWKAMEKLVNAGKTRSIGLSNFTAKKIDTLLKTATILPTVNQVESHPYLQQEINRKYCQSKDIVFEAYSPLGNPGFFKSSLGDNPTILEQEIVISIADKLKATPGQVLIAYALAKGACTIPKSTKKHRLEENMKAVNIKLEGGDVEKISGLERGLRFCGPTSFYYPTNAEEYWDGDFDSQLKF